MKQPITVIIAAAGQGTRFGGQLPKQFTLMGGKPVLAYAYDLFSGLDWVTEIILTVPEPFVSRTLCIVNAAAATALKRVQVITGGENRQYSVYKALKSVSSGTGIVLVHDGARPFVTAETVHKVVNGVISGYAVVAGIPATDTVKLTGEDGLVAATPPRETIWYAQTPQGFMYDVILRAHELAAAENFIGTDDAGLVERYGLAPVKMVQGGRGNIKITTREDVFIGESLLTMPLTYLNNTEEKLNHETGNHLY